MQPMSPHCSPLLKSNFDPFYHFLSLFLTSGVGFWRMILVLDYRLINHNIGKIHASSNPVHDYLSDGPHGVGHSNIDPPTILSSSDWFV